MANRRSILSFIIDLKDRATGGLQRLNADGLGAIRKGAALVTRTLVVGTAVTLGYVAATAKLAKRGGEVLGVQRAFARQVGGALHSSLIRLRGATRGLINNYELMAGFNRALTLGAVENTEQFEELSKTAIALGRSLGVDAAFAMESLSLGIGRQSKLILDNLGLIVSVEDANKAYAEQLGKTTSELTDQEKAIAFRNAALSAAQQKVAGLGEIEDNAGDAVTRFKVAVTNAKDEIAKLIAQSPLVESFFDRMTQITDSVTAVIVAGTPTMRIAAEQSGFIIGNAFAEGALRGLIGLFDKLQAVALKPFNDLLNLLGFDVDVAAFIQSINPIRTFLIATAEDASDATDRALARLKELVETAQSLGQDEDPVVDPVELEGLEVVLGFWTQVGLKIEEAQEAQLTLVDTTSGALLNSVVNFGQVFQRTFERMPNTFKTLGQAFAGAMLGALASVAAGFSKFYAAQAAAALAQGLKGDPRGFAAAGKYTLASVAMGTLAGVIGGAASGLTAGGVSVADAGLDTFNDDFGGSGRGRATIIIQGDRYLDMSDPSKRQAFADALTEAGANRDFTIVFQGG